jgi:hypothetical protein
MMRAHLLKHLQDAPVHLVNARIALRGEALLEPPEVLHSPSDFVSLRSWTNVSALRAHAGELGFIHRAVPSLCACPKREKLGSARMIECLDWAPATQQNEFATAQRDRKELAGFGVNKRGSDCRRLQFVQ